MVILRYICLRIVYIIKNEATKAKADQCRSGTQLIDRHQESITISQESSKVSRSTFKILLQIVRSSTLSRLFFSTFPSKSQPTAPPNTTSTLHATLTCLIPSRHCLDCPKLHPPPTCIYLPPAHRIYLQPAHRITLPPAQRPPTLHLPPTCKPHPPTICTLQPPLTIQDKSRSPSPLHV